MFARLYLMKALQQVSKLAMKQLDFQPWLHCCFNWIKNVSMFSFFQIFQNCLELLNVTYLTQMWTSRFILFICCFIFLTSSTTLSRWLVVVLELQQRTILFEEKAPPTDKGCDWTERCYTLWRNWADNKFMWNSFTVIRVGVLKLLVLCLCSE